MAIRNPCDEPRRKRRGPRGVTAENLPDINLAGTTPATDVAVPSPEDPFAESALGAPIASPAPPEPPAPPEAGQGPQAQTIQPEVQYISATRDLTTIDEDSFYRLVSQRVISEKKINASSIWLSQKTEEGVIDQADRFRLALMNFWSFNGESEVMVSRPIGDPRTGQLRQAFLFGDNSNRLSDYNPISFRPYQSPQFFAGEYFRLDNPNSAEYSSLENFPFAFEQARTVLAMSDLPNTTKASHFMDFYMKGSSSSIWLQGREEYWSENPEKRDFYSSGNIEFGKQFHDHTFDAPAAFFESEINNLILAPDFSAGIEVRAWNADIHGDITSELQVPNMYQYYQARQITRLINDDQLLVENLPPYEVAYNQLLISNYEEEANNIDFETQPILKFPSTRVAMLEEINEAMRPSLTNYIEIGINKANSGPVSRLIQRNGMDTITLQFLHGGPSINRTREIIQKLFTKVLDDQFIAPAAEEDVNETINDEAIQGVEETVFGEYDKQIAAVPTNAGRNTAGYFWNRDLQEYPLYYPGWDNRNIMRLQEAIRSQIFISQLNQHIEAENLERTLADTLYGRKAYSETIGYKVEKYRINKNEEGQETEEKIQEFLLMDSDDVSKINLIDTQVLPGRRYVYKVFTINFVIGIKYEYSEQLSSFSWEGTNPRYPERGEQVLDVETYTADKSRFDLVAQSGRTVSLIYAPFFEKRVALTDMPPLSPQVSFLPYHGVDNKHAVLVETNYGEVNEVPISIYEEDEALIKESYLAQNLRKGSKLLYRTDSLPTEFEMIRIETEPESYSDFSQQSATRKRVPATGKTGFFITGIQPNKYYYYIFRTHDKGGVSNPSEVFRVRIVSYQNGIFMELDPYEMKRKQENYSVPFERLLKIRPSADQRVVNFEKVFENLEVEQEASETSLSKLRKELGLKGPSDLREFQKSAPRKEDISLGKTKQEDVVWGKNFKIRIKSKSTGRKMDLNITFNKDKSIITREE